MDARQISTARDSAELGRWFCATCDGDVYRGRDGAETGPAIDGAGNDGSEAAAIGGPEIGDVGAGAD